VSVDRHRLLLIVAVLTGVAVLVLGFLLGVQPQLAAGADARTQQESVDAQNDALRAATAELRAESERLPELRTELAAAEASVPAEAAMPTLLRQLDEMATGANVTVSGFTTADAVSYEVPASAAAPVADAGASTEGTDTSAEGSAPTADATDGAAAGAPPAVTDPLVTAATFSTIAVTVDVEGSYAQALEFVDRLQKGSRLFLVTTITSSEPEEGAVEGAGQTWTVGGLVYVMRDGTATGPAPEAVTPAQAESGDGTADTAAGR